jgi:hypothetical protein
MTPDRLGPQDPPSNAARLRRACRRLSSSCAIASISRTFSRRSGGDWRSVAPGSGFCSRGRWASQHRMFHEGTSTFLSCSRQLAGFDNSLGSHLSINGHERSSSITSTLVLVDASSILMVT